MPKDRIDAAIKSAKGGLLHDNYKNITYEGYACGGVAGYQVGKARRYKKRANSSVTKA